MDYISRIRKRKKRQLLILSASSINSGLDALYLEVQDNTWHILHSQTMHYPQSIKTLIKNLDFLSTRTISLPDLALIDNRMTTFLAESAKKIVSHIPQSRRHLDVLCLKKFSLWQGSINKQQKPGYWNVALGDAHYLARHLKTPILTDFIRQDMLNQGTGILNTLYGNRIISGKAGETAVFVNIGLIADMVVIDQKQQKIIINSDTGPGTCLIDLAAKEAGCDHGFDRDGSTASAGTVTTEVLEQLLEDSWFQRPSPKRGFSDHFKQLYRHQSLQELSPADRLATVTAFTALTISNFYKKEFSNKRKPETIWLSGGGLNNLALIDFLKAYFTPLPVKNIEELGIPSNGMIPLSLGLTVQGMLNQQNVFIGHDTLQENRQLGNWVFP